jgi:hypothetical protein
MYEVCLRLWGLFSVGTSAVIRGRRLVTLHCHSFVVLNAMAFEDQKRNL